MNITNVAWVEDRLGQRALDLRLDGHPAHFRSSQRSALLERGIVAGVAYLQSELPDLTKNAYVRGAYGPAIGPAELVGCTDDPGVFALFTEMCRAIRAGTWVAGPRAPIADCVCTQTTDPASAAEAGLDASPTTERTAEKARL